MHLNPVRYKLLSAEEPLRALAAGDDDDAGMDCGALADGKREHVEEYAAIGQ